MPLDKDALIGDLRNVIATDPVDVVYEGQTVAGILSRLEAEQLAANPGLAAAYGHSVQCVLSDWNPLPPIDSVITVAGAEYRLLAQSKDGPQVAVRFDLGDKFASSLRQTAGW